MQCAAHPASEASHECTLCGVWSCAACVRPLRTAGNATPMYACPACGGLAVTRAPARDQEPPSDELGELLKRPFTGEGLTAIIALAVPYWLMKLPSLGCIMGGFLQKVLWIVMGIVYLGALTSYYFQTVNHVGLGRPGLPFSAAAEDRDSMSASLARGLVCLLVALGPVIASGFVLEPTPLVSFAAFTFGLAVVPASILAIVITGTAVNGLWPPVIVSIIERVPLAYAKLTGLFLVSSTVWWLGDLAASATLGKVPLAGDLLVGMTNNLLVLLQAVLVGGFLRRNADDLGYA